MSNICGSFECNILTAWLYTIMMPSWSIYISDKKNLKKANIKKIIIIKKKIKNKNKKI